MKNTYLILIASLSISTTMLSQNDSIKVYGVLGIGDEYSFPTTDGTSGQLLKTNGSGQLSWSDSTSAIEVNDLTDGIASYGIKNNLLIGLGGDSLNATANENVAFGNYALYAIKGANSNTAVGFNALRHNEYSFSNTAIGRWTLADLQDGHSNTALGSNAMSSTISGTANVGIGSFALQYADDSFGNTAIGLGAGGGTSLHSKFYGVYIGYEAGRHDTTDQKLYIENTDSSTPLIWGDFANDSVKIYGVLGVGDEFVFPTIDGSGGQVLMNNGMKQLVWTNPTFKELSDTDGNTKIQVEENPNDDIIRFDINGTEVLTMKENSYGSLLIEPKNTSGNIFIGEGSGSNNNASPINFQGIENTFVGFNAGLDNTEGNWNTFVGVRAGLDNTEGSKNTFIGTAAGLFNTTGFNNTYLGEGVGAGNQTGSFNTCVGAFAGESSTGNANVFLGYSAGSNETGSHKLHIENNGSPKPLIWGDFAFDSVKVYGVLGIGDEYVFPDTNGLNGQVLMNNGMKQLVWTNPTSTELRDTDGNTKIQVEENPNDNIIRFDINGTEVLTMKKNSHGSLLIEPQNLNYNTFVGRFAGGNNDPSMMDQGKFNTFIGDIAGRDNTVGASNTFIGSGTGIFNTDGSDNTFLGAYAGTQNTTGLYNTYIGSFAGQSANGNSNVFIGYHAGYNETGNDKLYIENSNSSTPLIYGDFDNDKVNINGRQGINVADPVTDLHIKQQNTNNGIRLEYQTDTDFWDTYIDNANDYNFGFNGVLKAYINDADGSYNVASDARLKSEIKPIEDVLSSVVALNPTTYTYTADQTKRKQIGFIAQEVEQLFPEAVNEKNGYKAINYAVFSVLAIQAIQEQQRLIEQQEDRLKTLEVELPARIEKLEKNTSDHK